MPRAWMRREITAVHRPGQQHWQEVASCLSGRAHQQNCPPNAAANAPSSTCCRQSSRKEVRQLGAQEYDSAKRRRAANSTTRQPLSKPKPQDDTPRVPHSTGAHADTGSGAMAQHHEFGTHHLSSGQESQLENHPVSYWTAVLGQCGKTVNSTVHAGTVHLR